MAFEDDWEKKQLEIETDVEDGVMVCCDAELLTLVWNNLFSNVIKFTDRGGCVSLSLRTEGDAAVVRVADIGCGFGAEVGAHIFEKFYQGDPSRASQGNGLRLALVRRVVDIVGGDIALPSFALVIYVLAVGEGNTPRAYLSYFASAYALAIIAAHVPAMADAFREGFAQYPGIYGALHSRQGERLRRDAFFRTEVSLRIGLGINALYAAVKLTFGVLYRSAWFGVLAGYYLLLALETAMLTQFGSADQELLRMIMVSSTGAAVCVIVLAVAA